MIEVFNPDRLTRQPFFQALINYLHTHEDVILRQIKRDFPTVKHLERSIENYVQAGYILRQDKRYSLSLPLLEKAEQISLDQMIFVDTTSSAYAALTASRFETRLANATNEVILVEQTGFARNELTLDNYFYKLKTEQSLSSEQQVLYNLLGDVNPDYALKYMTTFLLKFVRKEVVKQKRADIFVDSLVILGYLEKVEEDTYALNMEIDKESLLFRAKFFKNMDD